MKNKCDRYRKHLSGWLDGELDSPLAEAISIHTQTCGACRLEAEAIQHLSEAALRLPEPEPPSPAFTAQIMDRIHAKRQKTPNWAQLFVTRTVYALVFCVVCFLGVLIYWKPFLGQTAPDSDVYSASNMAAINQKMIKVSGDLSNASLAENSRDKYLDSCSELLVQGIGLRLSQVQDQSLDMIYNSASTPSLGEGDQSR